MDELEKAAWKIVMGKTLRFLLCVIFIVAWGYGVVFVTDTIRTSQYADFAAASIVFVGCVALAAVGFGLPFWHWKERVKKDLRSKG